MALPDKKIIFKPRENLSKSNRANHTKLIFSDMNSKSKPGDIKNLKNPQNQNLNSKKSIINQFKQNVAQNNTCIFGKNSLLNTLQKEKLNNSDQKVFYAKTQKKVESSNLECNSEINSNFADANNSNKDDNFEILEKNALELNFEEVNLKFPTFQNDKKLVMKQQLSNQVAETLECINLNEMIDKNSFKISFEFDFENKNKSLKMKSKLYIQKLKIKKKSEIKGCLTESLLQKTNNRLIDLKKSLLQLKKEEDWIVWKIKKKRYTIKKMQNEKSARLNKIRTNKHLFDSDFHKVKKKYFSNQKINLKKFKIEDSI